MIDHRTLFIGKLGRSLVARRSAWLDGDRSPAAPYFHNHLRGLSHRERFACMLRARDVAGSFAVGSTPGQCVQLGVGQSGGILWDCCKSRTYDKNSPQTVTDLPQSTARKPSMVNAT